MRDWRQLSASMHQPREYLSQPMSPGRHMLTQRGQQRMLMNRRQPHPQLQRRGLTSSLRDPPPLELRSPTWTSLPAAVWEVSARAPGRLTRGVLTRHRCQGVGAAAVRVPLQDPGSLSPQQMKRQSVRIQAEGMLRVGSPEGMPPEQNVKRIQSGETSSSGGMKPEREAAEVEGAATAAAAVWTDPALIRQTLLLLIIIIPCCYLPPCPGPLPWPGPPSA